MNPSRSSSKRSRSPAVPSPVSPPARDRERDLLPPMDRACLGKAAVEPAEGPKMPAFLQLTKDELNSKFSELAMLENERLLDITSNPCGDWARGQPDRVLDRYTNVSPWSYNRVKLQVPDGYNDYINASHVTLVSTSSKRSKLKTPSQDTFICMQGPKLQTVDHVWHMLWHSLSVPGNSSPGVIVMLTPTHSPHPGYPSINVEKCYPYYPLDENSPPLVINESSQLGENFKAVVRFVEREETTQGGAIEVRKLSMAVEGHAEEKIIWHFLYPIWPDFGALEVHNVDSILALMALSREKNISVENPRVVHCSAGVGRTGTFIALEFLLGELQRGEWEGWDDSAATVGKDPVFEVVNQLRMQRRTMVQSYQQYAFLYQVLAKFWVEKYNSPGGYAKAAQVDLDAIEPPLKVVKKSARPGGEDDF